MGEHWDFEAYIQATMGFCPVLSTEQQIDQQRQEAEERLAPLGIKLDTDTIENLNAVDEKIPEEEIADFYKETLSRNLAALSSCIGEIPSFNFKVEFTDVDAYWQNWVSGSRKDYLLCFNKRNVPIHYKSFSMFLAFHEMLGHLVQAAILYENIQKGIVPQCMGLTTIYDQDQFQSEGIAQTLTYFLDTDDMHHDLILARREMDIYKYMVMSNMHLMINSGQSIEKCTDYGTAHLPFKTSAEMAHSLASKMNNPQFRCYEYVYGPSAVFFKKFAQQASASQKQKLLACVYNEGMSPDELIALSCKIVSG